MKSIKLEDNSFKVDILAVGFLLVFVQGLSATFLHIPMLIAESFCGYKPCSRFLCAVLDFTFYVRNITNCHFTGVFPLKMSVFVHSDSFLISRFKRDSLILKMLGAMSRGQLVSDA